MRRVVGRDNPVTSTAMHDLALTYKVQGRLQEAESLMEEAVTLEKEELGESHADTQMSIRSLEKVRRRIQSDPDVFSAS